MAAFLGDHQGRHVLRLPLGLVYSYAPPSSPESSTKIHRPAISTWMLRLLEGRFQRGILSPRFSPHGSDTLEERGLRRFSGFRKTFDLHMLVRMSRRMPAV